MWCVRVRVRVCARAPPPRLQQEGTYVAYIIKINIHLETKFLFPACLWNGPVERAEVIIYILTNGVNENHFTQERKVDRMQIV